MPVRAKSDVLKVKTGPKAPHGWRFRLGGPEKEIRFSNTPIEVPRYYEYEVMLPLPGTPQEKRPSIKRVDLHEMVRRDVADGRLEIVG